METQHDPWFNLMTRDVAQEDADARVARTVMQEQLISMGHAQAELRRELQKYPLFEGSTHQRNVPIVNGRLPAKLQRLMDAAYEEESRTSIPGTAGYVEPVVDSRHLVGTSSEFMVHRLAAKIIQQRLDAPVNMAKTRRVQGALDELYAPDPAPQDPRPFSPWGAL